ncbi:MAG: hypothetical protein KJ906_00835 [Nanoarchaeota archaeon]|nr:hypothetical protein [Nanoarchaeota archaeon]
MKKLILLSLVAIIFVSGCIDFGGSRAFFGISEITDNPDMYMLIEASTDQIKVDRYVQLRLTVENDGDSTLSNMKINAYDQCLFAGDSVKDIVELRPNKSSMWIWKWQAINTEIDRDCTIRLKTEYDTETKVEERFNVLTESEFYAREEQGRLKEIRGSSSTTDNTLKINVEFSEAQPFLEGEQIFAYISYTDIGKGFLNKLEGGNVTIEFPNNAENVHCSGYSGEGNTLTLMNGLTFVKRVAPQTTCKFTTKANQLVDIGDMSIIAKYKYQFDNSLLLKVTAK